MAQRISLPLTVSCFSKIQIGFTFLVPAHPGSPGQRAVKRVCVCVYITYWNAARWEPRHGHSKLTTTTCTKNWQWLDIRHKTGSLGHLGHLSRPGHRVIILTWCETRVFPVFWKNAQNAKRTFEMLKWQKSVSVFGLKSLDVSPCNELLLLPMIMKNSLAWGYFFVTFRVHYRTGSSDQLGLRVAGFPGHWVAGSRNVTQFRDWGIVYAACWPVCACWRRHSLTGLQSNSSLLVVTLKMHDLKMTDKLLANCEHNYMCIFDVYLANYRKTLLELD